MFPCKSAVLDPPHLYPLAGELLVCVAPEPIPDFIFAAVAAVAAPAGAQTLLCKLGNIKGGLIIGIKEDLLGCERNFAVGI